jgi:hypothetical protein
MTRVYYKEAVAAFVFFDVTRSSTLEGAHKWKADLDAKVRFPVSDRPIPTILVACKVKGLVCTKNWRLVPKCLVASEAHCGTNIFSYSKYSLGGFI